MIVIGVCFVGYTYSTLVGEAVGYISEITDLSAESVAKKLEASSYSQESFTAYIGEKDKLDDEAIIEMLKDELNLADNSMIRVTYTDANGDGYTVRDDNVVNRVNISDTSYFKTVVKGYSFISETMTDVITGQPVNIYAVPVFDNGKVVGVHTGVCRSSILEDELKADYFDGRGQSYIIDKNVNRVIDSTYKESGDNEPFRDINANEAMLESIRQDIAKAGEGGALVVKNANGKYMWVDYSPIGVNGWYVLLVVPYSYVVSNAVKMLCMDVILLIMSVLAAIFVARYLDYIKQESNRKLNHRIYYDELSGLYSKNGLLVKAPEILSDDWYGYSIVFIDIDNFRSINELFGYDAGTNILKKVGEILQSAVGENELAARAAGDDFILIIKAGNDDEIRERLHGIIETVSESSFDENSTNYNVVMYFGVYKFDSEPSADKMESYIDKAKMSLLRLDSKRRSECAFYDEDLQKQLRFDAELENDMQSAIDDGDFKVYVQPKYDARTRKLAGGEALIRWQHKTKGFLTPNKFVPLFEKNGFITEVDMYVYDKVCAMQRKLLDEGYTPVPISVNQSRLHLYRADYIETLKSILAKYDLPAKYVELEITENIALSSGKVLEAAVKKIHSLGFTVSMDDFGSGESSLNILKDIDIDVLKLDRMFFLETENNVKARQIIKSVIDMANRLKISTVAEGVENEDQLRFLQDAGCDLIQGYLLGKPMPYEEFEALFKKENNNK
jgi:diguanylate cyclase (GGDEF)-like protein